MKIISNDIIVGCWLVFSVYWLVSALAVKRTAEQKSWQSSLAYRVPLALGIALIVRPSLFDPLKHTFALATDGAVGVTTAVCVLGLLTAIWARRTLAGNWSSVVALKQEHELIQTGPYRFVRHPIYTGILLMLLSTVVARGRIGDWLGFVFICTGIWVKLRQEESLMLRHFPDQYPAYRRHVKAIVPFVI